MYPFHGYDYGNDDDDLILLSDSNDIQTGLRQAAALFYDVTYPRNRNNLRDIKKT
jgi:hypothetical protein